MSVGLTNALRYRGMTVVDNSKSACQRSFSDAPIQDNQGALAFSKVGCMDKSLRGMKGKEVTDAPNVLENALCSMSVAPKAFGIALT